jgi:predicted Zn-dependent peptidase
MRSAAGNPAPNSEDPKIPHTRYQLDNGLEVILIRDTSVPIVAVNLWYHVGSGDEELGKSGFAHLFEHMLFQGSAHIGPDQHFAILRSVGAVGVNGTTNTDRTNYFEVVPSNELETALWLESDRMGFLLPSLTEAALKNQIDVVRNERRQRQENVPYGLTGFEIEKALYPEGHPYRYRTIGKHEDLEAASLDDVKKFYKKWYTPANATLVLAGDFELETAKKAVQKWFGGLRGQPRPEHRELPTPRIQRTRLEVKDHFAKLTRIDYVWHSPAFFHDGDSELDILADVLGRPGTGRLYERLVSQEELAQTVFVGQNSRQLSSFFQIGVIARSGADVKKIEKIIDEEVDRLRKEPVTAEEFKRTQVALESQTIWSLESLLARAEILQKYNHYVGDPDYLTRDLDRYRKSSPARCQEIAKRVFDDKARGEVITVPVGRKDEKSK